ncbi:MAG: cupin domain-containing protein [Burkholderiaceae bacterium]|jgi:quercetin dioxygenase-like cupin family protein|nr:cupin domain-containing protein [Burkholderiaceae bacterium]
MALEHASPRQAIDLHAHDGLAISTSLLRTDHLQLLRLVLPAGHTLPQHHVRGDLTLHCLAGEADVATAAGHCSLAPGMLVMLPAGEPHALRALSDCVVLVTLTEPGRAATAT